MISIDEMGGEVRSGELVTVSGSHRYPIREFVPRFVQDDNYAATFGLQWTRFRKTQLDSHSGVSITRDRFYAYTGWTPEELDGKLVLDVGCGAGRFTEVALAAGAQVVALDYSVAVDACRLNHAGNTNLTVVQGDMYAMPFQPGQFDFVYCLGVLQHTPDVRKSFLSVAQQLKPGGRLAVDVYPRLWKNLLWPKYWLRPVTRHLPPERLFSLIESIVPFLLPVSRVLARIPAIGRTLRFAVPVVNYEGVYPLTEKQLKEWAVLDTFDMLSPAHDHPQTPETLGNWFREASLDKVVVKRMGFIVGRGTRPSEENAPSAERLVHGTHGYAKA